MYANILHVQSITKFYNSKNYSILYYIAIVYILFFQSLYSLNYVNEYVHKISVNLDTLDIDENKLIL